MWFLELFPFAIVNFETENNVVFTTCFFLFCFQPENVHCGA